MLFFFFFFPNSSLDHCHLFELCLGCNAVHSEEDLEVKSEFTIAAPEAVKVRPPQPFNSPALVKELQSFFNRPFKIRSASFLARFQAIQASNKGNYHLDKSSISRNPIAFFIFMQ